MYQRIDGRNWRHIYLVGDLHGCLAQFAGQLRKVRFDPWQDLVISVGDLIDRGPDSPGCLALIGKPWFRAVQGNHEVMALNSLQNTRHDTESGFLWEMNGGRWFRQLNEAQKKQAEDLFQRCKHLPFIIELLTQDKRIIIAHADYPLPHWVWQADVDPALVVWSRERLQRNIQGKGEPIEGADAFYFGHTPLKTPLHFFNQHYIDTGAVFGNTLTLVAVQ
ncbi:metallophosphoesterase [Mangrovibacter plantisponsor]|uniref:Serine/threonine protein phosphatase 1 n=1 Tax=Mangrovibacter plantisponsor TaxID=451513 RepID=A0A317PY98_9ENTR|nr:metallophosphoesterase [Mangrovibacter plantisponsor]PWW07660.1 serine/threonine protein phosphatase 1 [Mangrovibacter plantisponsor]